MCLIFALVLFYLLCCFGLSIRDWLVVHYHSTSISYLQPHSAAALLATTLVPSVFRLHPWIIDRENRKPQAPASAFPILLAGSTENPIHHIIVLFTTTFCWHSNWKVQCWKHSITISPIYYKAKWFFRIHSSTTNKKLLLLRKMHFLKEIRFFVKQWKNFKCFCNNILLLFLHL